MYFSHFSARVNRRLVEEAGFVVERAEVVAEPEDRHDARFLWVVARVRDRMSAELEPGHRGRRAPTRPSPSRGDPDPNAATRDGTTIATATAPTRRARLAARRRGGDRRRDGARLGRRPRSRPSSRRRR